MRKHKVCSRCQKWHQRLLYCWDNMQQEYTLICLSCIAELVANRLPNVINKHHLKEVLEEVFR